jgi:hypothetical protein
VSTTDLARLFDVTPWVGMRQVAYFSPDQSNGAEGRCDPAQSTSGVAITRLSRWASAIPAGR